MHIQKNKAHIKASTKDASSRASTTAKRQRKSGRQTFEEKLKSRQHDKSARADRPESTPTQARDQHPLTHAKEQPRERPTAQPEMFGDGPPHTGAVHPSLKTSTDEVARSTQRQEVFEARDDRVSGHRALSERTVTRDRIDRNEVVDHAALVQVNDQKDRVQQQTHQTTATEQTQRADRQMVDVLVSHIVKSCHVGENAKKQRVLLMSVDVPGQGTVQIKLERKRQGTSLRFRVQDDALAQRIKTHTPQLQSRLRARGVGVSHVAVVSR